MRCALLLCPGRGSRTTLFPLFPLEMVRGAGGGKKGILVLKTTCVHACDRREVCVTARVLNSGHSSLELVFSFYLCMGSGTQTQAARLVWQAPPLAEPPHELRDSQQGCLVAASLVMPVILAPGETFPGLKEAQSCCMEKGGEREEDRERGIWKGQGLRTGQGPGAACRHRRGL